MRFLIFQCTELPWRFKTFPLGKDILAAHGWALNLFSDFYIVYVLAVHSVEFFVTIILPLIVNEMQNQYLKKTLQMVSYLPYFISTVIIVAMLHQILSMSGMVNQFRTLLGMTPQSFLPQELSVICMCGRECGVGYGLVSKQKAFWQRLSSREPDHPWGICRRMSGTLLRHPSGGRLKIYSSSKTPNEL